MMMHSKDKVHIEPPFTTFGETRKVAYTCRYTSGHLIPDSVMVIPIHYLHEGAIVDMDSKCTEKSQIRKMSYLKFTLFASVNVTLQV